MKLSIPPYEVMDDSDFFSRRPFGQVLANIVKNSTDPLVIGLDGNWGEGKTTFIKMWQRMLDSEELPNLYIDAFACDHVDDAFMVVAGAITDYVKLKSPPEKAALFIDKAKKVGTHALSLSTKIAIRAASIGVIKDSDFKEFQKIADDISKDFGATAEKYIEERLSNHKSELETIQNFKNYLSTLPESLGGSKNSSLTIIIDELDRCRPSFAVEILEKIKHLFSARNINFVLVINKSQLEESIRTTYGSGIDAHTYLQKFITIEARLPKNETEYESDIEKYSEHLAHLHELPNNTEAPTIFAALGKHFNVSFRQLEKAYSNLALISLSQRSIEQTIFSLACFVSIIKVVSPETFLALSTKKISYQNLCEKIDYDEDRESKNHVITYVMNWIKYTLLSDSEYEELPSDDAAKTVAKRYYNISRRGQLDIFLLKLNNLKAN